jgi:hypothetical protein
MHTLEPVPRRAGPVSYPCVACGSLVAFSEVYCDACLRAIRNGSPRPDRYIDRILAEIERAA